MKKLIFFFALFISGISVSQNINNYKYAVISEKFEFQKSPNQYNLNTLTKSYFQKIGMQSFLDSDILPTEVANENCNKIYISAEESNNMFSTKIKIIIKNCQNKIIFTSDEGVSRTKEYEVAYNEAFRMALNSINKLHYQYQEKKQETDIHKNTETTFSESKQSEVSKNGLSLESPNTYSTTLIPNGYTILDKSGQIFLKILETSTKDLFIAQSFDKNGILIKKHENWFFEYYKNDIFFSEKIELKL